jgi:hypothetical protein
MTKDETLRLALEALESSDKLINGDERKMGLCDALDGYYGFGSDIEKYNKQTDKVIKTIKEALAKLEHCSDCGQKLGDANHIHTCSPQRTWVGLTYEDMTKLQKDLYDAKGESVLPTTFAMAVEAKLKELNL